MTVGTCRTKSSAVSVSILPGLGRRESAPSSPLGLPVAKKKGAAQRGVARHALKHNRPAIRPPRDITTCLGLVVAFRTLLNELIILIRGSFLSNDFTDERLVPAAGRSHNAAVIVR